MTAERNRASPALVYPDVIGLLSADHRTTEALFAEIAANKDTITPHQKFELVKKVCGEILIHLAIEEAIFYPTVRAVLKDADLMDEAESEHDLAKQLIIQLGTIQPDDPVFDVKVSALADEIEHHVLSEESLIFPRLLGSDLDLVQLGRQLLEAKNTMRTRFGLPTEQTLQDQFTSSEFYFGVGAARSRAGVRPS